MRFLMKVYIPVEAGNDAARKGQLGVKIAQIVEEMKAEAAYFLADEKGQRTGYIFFDMQEASEIPKIAEPWFLAFNAKLECFPVMIPEDLQKAHSYVDKAVEKYGQ